MESERINFLINNPTEAKSEDIQLLKEQAVLYPYAQVLHVLLAKISDLLNSETKSSLLTTAAVYSSDRSALKKVIQNKNYLKSIDQIVAYQDLPSFDLESPIYEDSDDLILEDKDDSATIFDEVLKNLEKLKSLRQQFQFLELQEEPRTETNENLNKEDAKKENKVQTKEKKLEHKEPKKESTITKKNTSKKKKLDEILEIDEVLDTKVNAYFLSEIEEKKNPATELAIEKTVAQNDLIEKFIEEQPSIGSIKKELDNSHDEVNRDLSEKSTKFGDDLISENLAIILLKQGKKERAIDIYKKLIWKLPQKKAYFAARIEEIKN